MSEIPHKNQIRWACRRGMLELDRFLLPFFDECFDALSPQQQTAFVAMLNEGDQTLFHWLLGTTAPEDAQWQRLCTLIREHAQHNH